ncbi:MAG: hypothetical protein E7269_00480 [Lachnospiraceae bacterium]|nr:hypothetical protein [Lachnospiraceae bacterium]
MRNTENRTAYPPSHMMAAQQDQMYFKEMLTPNMQRVLQEIDRVLDQLEYEGSPMFDEYPDKAQLMRLGDMIYQRLPGAEDASEPAIRDYLQAILLQEIFHRRCRYRRHCW